jgi:hypothetical protein
LKINVDFIINGGDSIMDSHEADKQKTQQEKLMKHMVNMLSWQNRPLQKIMFRRYILIKKAKLVTTNVVGN